jgi:SAM-dependent methyltransferase
MHIAPDGSPVELYRRLPARTTEARLINALLNPNSDILDLGCGTGRLAEPLCRAGHSVVGVDNEPEMLDGLQLTEGVAADIENLDLGHRFDAVLLMSHFVNDADDTLVRRLLGTVRRHLAPGGLAIVERHAPGWVLTCEEGTTTRDGVTYTLTVLERTDNILSAAVRYEFDGMTVEQRFRVREVDDQTLRDLAATANLRMASVVDEAATLIVLRSDSTL